MTTKHDVRSHAAKFQMVENYARGGRSGVRYFVHATIAVALAAAMYQPAQAQEAAEGRAASELQEVTITGSRIQRSPDLESSSPMVTVSQDVLTNKATVGLENALNELPQFVPAQTQFVTGDNSPTATNTPGAATINLRGLGTNRTLVLLDGRRAQPANATLVVDVNTIPAAAIDHVEVVTGGASAVYGADGIAGVVNFRLKSHFTGAEFDAQTGITEAGDGMESRLAATLGTDFADHRGNALLIFEWSKRNAVYQKNRDFYTDSWTDPYSNTQSSQLFSFNDYNPTGNLPSRAAVDSIFGAGTSKGAATFYSTAFWFNSDLTLFKNANTPNGTAGFNSALPPGTSKLAYQNNVLNEHFMDSYVSSPLTRYSMFSKVNYSLTDNVTAFFQGNFASSRVQSLTLASPERASWIFSLPYCSSQTLAAGTNANCATTRAKFPVPVQLATLLDSRPSRDANWTLESTPSYLGPRIAQISTTVFQVMGGLDGTLPFKDWTWEAYVSHGETNIDDNMRSGFFSVQRYGAVMNFPSTGANLPLGYGAGYSSSGLGASLGASATCTSGLPVFSSISFKPSADCLDAIGMNLNTRTALKQDIVEATTQGGLFNLPAGEVRGSLGVDWRRDSGAFVPDPALNANSTYETVAGNFATAGAQGSTEVKEVYGELLVPLLKDLPGIKSLNLELGDRFSKYDTAGNTSTWKALLNWAPFDFLTFRGGIQYAVRAPNLAELYVGASVRAVTFQYGDPCAALTTAPWGNIAANPNRAKVQTLCGQIISKFNPTSPYFLDPNTYAGGSATFLLSESQIVKGNPDVGPEKAHTVTVGTVFRSPFESAAFRQITATLDYYKINMTDTIGTIDSVTVYQNCFNYNGTSNPSYDPNNEFCQLIGRQTTNGGRAYTQGLYSNLGTLDTKGLDFTFNWRMGLDDVFGHGLPGSVGLNVSGTKLIGYKEQTAPTAAVVDRDGTGTYFKWRLLTGLSYKVGPANVQLQWSHLPVIKDTLFATQPATTIQPVDAYNKFNLSAGWEFSKTYSMRLGIDNLFDKQPPLVGVQPGVTDGAGNTNASVYDVLGRTYFVSFKASL